MSSVTRGPYYLLLVLALVLQCSPLCTCNLIEILAGREDHAANVTKVGDVILGQLTRHAHTCETPEGSQDCSGMCVAQKGVEQGRPASADRGPLVPFVLAFSLPPAPPCLSLESPFDRPDRVGPSGPNPPLNTPLLI